ncbi:arsenite methyltransferase [Propionibacterium sp.]|uniref:arsenite methyltransferase n=1 Tax=Propionibacterium sp. TaxID=1977903 RepID=UPI0039EAFB4A
MNPIDDHLCEEGVVHETELIRTQVRDRYAQAALAVEASGRELPSRTGSCCAGGSCCAPTADVGTDVDERFGVSLYASGDVAGVPAGALAASLGCGNPTAVADLHPEERVLDLGSGGGIDVLLSARRVGARGFAYGVDMTDEMLTLARDNAAKAGADNVEFLKGTIEDVPLPDASVDVVISNCVIDLSADKPKVLSEMFRVLTPGGRIGISDVVAEDGVTPAERAERGSYVGCIAGALSRREYLDGLAQAGFVGTSVEFTHEVTPGMHGAIVKAVKPVAGATR